MPTSESYGFIRRAAILCGVCVALAAGYYLGVVSAPSPGSDMIVDSAPPTTAQPGPTQTATAAPRPPAFDLVRISRGGTGVIAGRMVPGAVVALTANGETIADVRADENGDWVIILEEPLPVGAVELNLIGRANPQSPPLDAEEVVVVSVPDRGETQFVERQETSVVAIASPKDGVGASRILQRPSQTPFSDAGGALAVDTVDYSGETGVGIVSGRGLARTQVRLYFDSEFQGVVTVSDDGAWSVPLITRVSEGDHMLRLDQTLSDGAVQLRIEQPFVLDSPIDQSLASAGVLVRPGNSLWQIARRIYGRGTQYTLIFRENSEQILEPDLIYPGQLFKLPATPAAGG